MSIFDVFAQSPLGPLQEHMEVVDASVEKLDAFFIEALKGNWVAAEVLQNEIAELERKADHIKKEIRLNLPNGLFMPVSRSDLLALLAEQDRIANKSKDIAGIVFGRKVEIPGILTKQFKEYLDCSLAAANQANKAIHELDKLLESGFRGSEVDFVKNLINELDRIEHQSDELQIEVRNILFELENVLKPVDVIFLYKIIDWIGALADTAQNVGERLQVLLAR